MGLHFIIFIINFAHLWTTAPLENILIMVRKQTWGLLIKSKLTEELIGVMLCIKSTNPTQTFSSQIFIGKSNSFFLLFVDQIFYLELWHLSGSANTIYTLVSKFAKSYFHIRWHNNIINCQIVFLSGEVCELTNSRILGLWFVSCWNDFLCLAIKSISSSSSSQLS